MRQYGVELPGGRDLGARHAANWEGGPKYICFEPFIRWAGPIHLKNHRGMDLGPNNFWNFEWMGIKPICSKGQKTASKDCPQLDWMRCNFWKKKRRTIKIVTEIKRITRIVFLQPIELTGKYNLANCHLEKRDMSSFRAFAMATLIFYLLWIWSFLATQFHIRSLSAMSNQDYIHLVTMKPCLHA